MYIKLHIDSNKHTFGRINEFMCMAIYSICGWW